MHHLGTYTPDVLATRMDKRRVYRYNATGELELFTKAVPSSPRSEGVHATLPSVVPRRIVRSSTECLRPLPAGSSSSSSTWTVVANHAPVWSSKLPSYVGSSVRRAGELDVWTSTCCTESTGAVSNLTSTGLLDDRAVTSNLPPVLSSVSAIRETLERM